MRMARLLGSGAPSYPPDPRPRQAAAPGVRMRANSREGRMAVRAVSHIAVGVRDMTRALHFYCEVIGLYVCADRVQSFTSFTSGKPVRRRGVFLRWREGPH